MMTLTLLLSCTSGEVTPPGFLALGTLGEIQLQGATQQAREKNTFLLAKITFPHILSWFLATFSCAVSEVVPHTLSYTFTCLFINLL